MNKKIYTETKGDSRCDLRTAPMTYLAVTKLDPNNGGSKTYIPKNFYRTGGSKTYIPKNFYTRTTYITLSSEKFGGSGAPPRPLISFAPGLRWNSDLRRGPSLFR
ncbi:hypothetical protein Hanom_Chr14g01262771 [Helianthus anomalus]